MESFKMTVLLAVTVFIFVMVYSTSKTRLKTALTSHQGSYQEGPQGANRGLPAFARSAPIPRIARPASSDAGGIFLKPHGVDSVIVICPSRPGYGYKGDGAGVLA